MRGSRLPSNASQEHDTNSERIPVSPNEVRPLSLGRIPQTKYAMHSELAISELIGLIYDAAGDATRWPVFLEKLGAVLNSSASNLFVQDLRSQEFSMAAAVGMESSFQRSYESYYRTRNVYLIRGNHLLRTGSVCLGPAMCPDAIALRT